MVGASHGAPSSARRLRAAPGTTARGPTRATPPDEMRSSVVRRVERYQIHDAIAVGGMASVHLALLASTGGFTKLFAVKAMHPHLARDADFRAMFLDEARMVSRIRHSNVVSTLDILADGTETMLVMDYVHGPSLSCVLKRMRATNAKVPLPIAAKLACDLLEGLHAAHEARSETGSPLDIVHRDVSPQNLLVGADGSARVMDFGIATAADRTYATRTGEVKGKAWYMPPEQARGERVDRRADVYAAGAVLFELLTNRMPFEGKHDEVLFKLFLEAPPPPSSLDPEISFELDAIVLRALSKHPNERFATAREMSQSLRDVTKLAPAEEVAGWLAAEMREFFEERDALVNGIVSAKSSARPAVVAEAPTLDAPAPWPRAWVAAALALVVVTSGVLLARARVTEPRRPAVVRIETAAAPASSESAAPPPATSVAPAPEPAPSASAITIPHATGRTYLARPPRAAPAPSISAAPGSPPPFCCIDIGGKSERYSLRPDCVDNCSAGRR